MTKADLEAGRGGECPDGIVVDGPSLASLVCDSVLHRVVMADSVILDYGSATRVISANLFNALVVRDRTCRFPGCDRRASWCDAHHLVHVEDGGPTCPSNLVLLCRRHHTRLHRKGWSAELQADAELVVSDPGGRVFTSHPPGAPGPHRRCSRREWRSGGGSRSPSPPRRSRLPSMTWLGVERRR